MTPSVKGKAPKQRIQTVATTDTEVSEVYVSMPESALDGSKRSGWNIQQYLFPQDGALQSETSVRYLKAPYCLESARDSITTSDSDIATVNTSNHGSGG